MSDNEGTYAALMELQSDKRSTKGEERQEVLTSSPSPSSKVPARVPEDLSTTPYISQNYRFTEDELRWLRSQAYRLRERLGTKVSQNTILRVALAHLRDACRRSPHANPLVDAVSRLKK